MARSVTGAAIAGAGAGTSGAGSAPRILHVPADVGGHAFGLSRAERALGLQSDVAVLAGGPFGYGADMRYEIAGMPVWRQLAVRTALLGRALRSYDIIHFNFGQSMIPVKLGGQVLNELPLIKRAGKTIVVTFQGCDVRPQECCFCDQQHCRAENRYRLPNAARFLRYADRCFHLNPDLARWLPGSTFLPYASVDPSSVTPDWSPRDRSEVVVAHAPSNRDVKGTRHVISAFEALRAEGLPVRLDLVENVERAEVLRRVGDADVVVDQLLIGWYGGFALEAMALGKPVLCHIDDAAGNPFGDELPIVRATPETLAERLRELVASREIRARLGRASRAFAESRHDPRAVARQVLSGLVPLSGSTASG